MTHRRWAIAGALVVVLGGGGVCAAITRGSAPVPALAPAPVKLPSLVLDPPALRAITTLELTQPDPVDEGSDAHSITIERVPEGWEITSPIHTRASSSKVEALLDNLKDIAVLEARDGGTSLYEEAQLTDARAMHVVASSPMGKVRDLYFGRSDERGQVMRFAGNEAVFVVANSGPRGYSGFLYSRGLRSWREPAILGFDEAEAAEVEIVNTSGRFDFARSGAGWSATRTRRDRHGALGAPDATWPAFDPATIAAFLRAYRGLAADDYGDAGQRAESGVDDAEHTGGIVRIRLAGGGERVVRVGKRSTTTGRWAIKDSRWALLEGGDGTLYVLAPWTAGWATADAKTFEGAQRP